MTERPVGDAVDQALRSAVQALADAAPAVSDLDDLPTPEPQRQIGRGPLLALLATATVVLCSVVGWRLASGEVQPVATDDGHVDACAGAAQRPWCVDSPAGVALVDGLAWSVDRTGALVAVDQVTGSRIVEMDVMPGESARVVGQSGAAILVVAGDQLLIVPSDGSDRRVLVPRPGWEVVDAAGRIPICSWSSWQMALTAGCWCCDRGTRLRWSMISRLFLSSSWKATGS